MRAWTVTVWVVAVGCGKNAPDESDDTAGGPPPIPPASFLTDAIALDMDGAVDPATLTMHQVADTWTAALQVLLADSEVQNRLNVHNGPSLRSALEICWERPSPAMSEFTINYDACESAYGMKGGVRVEDHPSGPLLFNFLSFVVGDREIGGVLGLDAVAAPFQWVVYETDTFSPGLDNRVPITVTVDGLQNSTSYNGGLKYDPIPAPSFKMWGVADILTIDSSAYQIILGGTDQTLSPTVVPDTAVGSTCEWQACRCTTSGTNSYVGTFALGEVRIDLDDLQDADDGFDDPELKFPSEQLLAGRFDVTTTGCGEYDATFLADAEVSFYVEAVALESEIQKQCELLLIPDEHHCLELIGAARASAGITLTMDADKLSKAAQRAVRDSFDDSWCVGD